MAFYTEKNKHLKKITDEDLVAKLKAAEQDVETYRSEYKNRSNTFTSVFSANMRDDILDFKHMPKVGDLAIYYNYCMSYDKERFGNLKRLAKYNIHELVLYLKHVLEAKNQQSYTVVTNCTFVDGLFKKVPDIYYSIVPTSKYNKDFDNKTLPADSLAVNVLNNEDYVVSIPLFASLYEEISIYNQSEYQYRTISCADKNDFMLFKEADKTYYAIYEKEQDIFYKASEMCPEISKISDIFKMQINSDDVLITKAIIALARYKSQHYMGYPLTDAHYRDLTMKVIGEEFSIAEEAKTAVSEYFGQVRTRNN